MSDNRTLKPTSKRRQEARQQGRVAASGPLIGAVIWLGVALAIGAMGEDVVAIAKSTLRSIWSEPMTSVDQNGWDIVVPEMRTVALLVAPVLLTVLGIAIFSRIAQVGFLWLPDRILPKGDRIQPAKRFSELLSLDKIAMGIRAILVFVILCAVLVVGVWQQRESFVQLMLSPNIGGAVSQFCAEWGLLVGGSLFGVGLLDYAFQRYRFEQSILMTPDELRSEIQAVQPNPQIGAGRKNLQHAIRSGSQPQSEN